MKQFYIIIFAFIFFNSSNAQTPCSGGMAGTYPCNKVDLLAHIPLSTFGSSRGNDCWGWTSPNTNKPYVLMGLNDGTAFVDITDPINPIYLGKLPKQSSNSTWRDIKVYQNHAYIVSEADLHGMQIFDLTQLDTITHGGIPRTFSNTAHYNGFRDCHNMVINEQTGYGYRVFL